MREASFTTWLKRVPTSNQVMRTISFIFALILTVPDHSHHSLQTPQTNDFSAVEDSAGIPSEKTHDYASPILPPLAFTALLTPILRVIGQDIVITSSLTHRDASTTGAARAPPFHA